MTADSEQRRFTRIPFPGQVRVACGEDQAPCSGELLDISLKGVLMRRPDDWARAPERGSGVVLTIDLESGLHLEAEGTLAHVSDALVGIEFTTLPMESAAHLRRLVEMNLGAGDLLEREFDALLTAHHAG